MAYDYSSDNKSLELPNPYRLQNRLLFACAFALCAGGLLALTWARHELEGTRQQFAWAPLLVGIGMLAAGIGWFLTAAKRLRFFFGRGRPLSLAPEIGPGVDGSSREAEGYKGMLRDGGLVYPEPQGALNGLLYHFKPHLITAPIAVQRMAQHAFFNQLAFGATLLSFVLAWGILGTPDSRPMVAALYFLFAIVVLFKPLLGDDRARMSATWLIGLVVAAVVGPVLVGMGRNVLPTLTWSLHGQTLVLLIAVLISAGFVLAALFGHVDEPPSTHRSCEQTTLSMNGPPGALLTELDRSFQTTWVQGIPNRRYTRHEPQVLGSEGSGQFAGELFEETQPMPAADTAAPSLATALQSRRHRFLAMADLYACVLVLIAIAFALYYVRQFDPLALSLRDGAPLAWVGYSVILLLVAGFTFKSTSALWGRFNFTSELTWVELLGVWQRSRIGTGAQLTSRLHTDNDIVRVQSMTMRVWRARIESVVFGKDGERQVIAMFAMSKEAKAMSDALTAFAAEQSVFIAPESQADAARLSRLGAAEQLLGAPGASGVAAAGELHRALQVDAAHGGPASGTPAIGRYCSHCGTAAPADARFCSACGKGLAA